MKQAFVMYVKGGADLKPCPFCGGKALDGLAKRGVITPEQAEAAKRRIAEGGEA